MVGWGAWHAPFQLVATMKRDAIPGEMPLTGITGIHHVMIATPEGGESAARAFYGRTLGLCELPKPATLGARGGVWFLIGAIQLHLGIDPD